MVKDGRCYVIFFGKEKFENSDVSNWARDLAELLIPTEIPDTQ